MKKMINKQKIALIEKLLSAYHNGDCPYCYQKLHQFFHRKERRFGCGGNKIHPEDLQIREEDYIYAIDHVIKYGDLKELPKIKKLNEF